MPRDKCGDMPYTDPPGSVKTIFIDPDGEIAVCNDFYIGNAFETDIIEIIENYDLYKIPEMKAIIENGMKGLINWARTKGIETDPEGYYNICHLCTDIRKKLRLK